MLILMISNSLVSPQFRLSVFAFFIVIVIDDTNLSRLSSVLVIRRPGDPSLLAGFDEPRLGPALEGKKLN